MLVKAVLAPRAFAKETLPELFNVNVAAPSTPPLNVMFAEPVTMLVAPPRVTAVSDVLVTWKALFVVVYVPLKVTLVSLYVCAPIVVTVRRLSVPPAFVVMLERGVVPPTMPLIAVAPVVLSVKAKAPLIVPLNVIPPDPVVTVVAPPRAALFAMLKTLFVVVYVPFNVTVASLYVCAPVVVTFCKLFVPEESVVKEASAVDPPTMPLNVTDPAELIARAKAPLTVPVNVAAPVPVDTVVLPRSVVLFATLKALFVVVYVPFRLTVASL